ncbi:MAG: peroxidase family protein, partial [Pseudomonadota bacterium]
DIVFDLDHGLSAWEIDPEPLAEPNQTPPNDPQDGPAHPPFADHPLGKPLAHTPESPFGPGAPPTFEALLLREHNRWVDLLERDYPHWTDQQLFEAATLRVEAQIQAITFNEVLPLLTGMETITVGQAGDDVWNDHVWSTEQAVGFLTAAIIFLDGPGLPDPFAENTDTEALETLVARLVASAMTDGLYGGEYASTIVDHFPRLFAADISPNPHNGLSEGELAALWQTKLADLMAHNPNLNRVDDHVVLLLDRPITRGTDWLTPSSAIAPFSLGDAIHLTPGDPVY